MEKVYKFSDEVYTFNSDKLIVTKNGFDFDLMNNLECATLSENGRRPFLKFSTKAKLYDTIEKDSPETHILYEHLSFYQENYINKIPKNVEVGIQPAVIPNELIEVMNKMSEKIDNIQTNTKLEHALIEGIVSKGKEIATEDLFEELKLKLDEFISKTYGALPDKIVIKNNEIEYEKVGIFHEQFEKVMKLVNLNMPVMLTGGAGAGKNFMLEQVSDALQLPFYYTSTITQEYKLTGFIDGGGVYHETEFYKAFQNGGVFMLDEIDASIPECLVILNGAIANGYFDFPNGRLHAHKDFRVVCAGNTVGLGADMVYTGRNVLDGATLDRFILVEIDYDKRIEENLCSDSELRGFLYAVRNAVKKNNIQHIIGMRCFKYTYTLLMNGFDKEFIIKSTVFKGLQIDDIKIIKKSLPQDNIWTLSI